MIINIENQKQVDFALEFFASKNINWNDGDFATDWCPDKDFPYHLRIVNDVITWGDNRWLNDEEKEKMKSFDEFKKQVETEAMRDAIEVKTNNSEVIANLNKKIDSQFEYIEILENLNEKYLKRLNEIESITFNYALENRIEEIEKIFEPTKQVHEIAQKYEITPELIEELKQFVK